MRSRASKTVGCDGVVEMGRNVEREARREEGLELGMVARRHWYVRSHDGQFYDAPAVEGGV